MDGAESARTLLKDSFGVEAAVTARAPGRVNLIGEHTDYAALPVLPIAIDRALWVAASPLDEPVVRAVSSSFDGVAEFARGTGGDRAHGWHRYVAGAVARMDDLAPGRGALVAIAGDLPPSGGLSSSSALTVGLISALMAAWEQPLDLEHLSRRATLAERAAGAETGAMDQQVIAFARAGSALRIDFSPLSRRFVPLPEGLAVVVASSGVEAPKGGAARDAYNERVIGMRLATALLAHQIGVDPAFPLRLGDIAGVDVVELLAEELQPATSVKDVSRLTGIPIAKLARFTAGPSWEITRDVPVRSVAVHILSEAERVNSAEQALNTGDLTRFGALLNESHASLRDNMDCSTPALDGVCEAMRGAGAYGARLTGAGFGGYAVAVCDPDRVPAIVEAAKEVTGGAPAFAVESANGVELV